jgi:putative DNA primase/helicase
VGLQPEQALESTALRTIAGEFFTDELAELGSKDAAMQTRGVWVMELSESRLSSAASPTGSALRVECVSSSPPRQCVFASPVNHGTYLRDETGERRFWPVVCGEIDIQALQRARDQIWAEANARLRSGASWWLETPDLVRLAGDQPRKLAIVANARSTGPKTVGTEQTLTCVIRNPRSTARIGAVSNEN